MVEDGTAPVRVEATAWRRPARSDPQARAGRVVAAPTGPAPRTGSRRPDRRNPRASASGGRRRPRRRCAPAGSACGPSRPCPPRPPGRRRRRAPEQHQLAAEALQHDLRAVALLARLVGPFARLELAFEVDRAALGQVALRDLAEALVEDHHPVPFGALAVLAAVAVAPALGGGDREMDDLRAVLGGADLRVAAEIADQDHLVRRCRPWCLSLARLPGQSSTRRGGCESRLREPRPCVQSRSACSTMLRAEGEEWRHPRAQAGARPRSDPCCRSPPAPRSSWACSGFFAQVRWRSAPSRRSLHHPRERFDHAAVIGAGAALQRQQRRSRGMEHGVVAVVNDRLDTLSGVLLASSAKRSALASASRACSSTGRSIMGTSSGP